MRKLFVVAAIVACTSMAVGQLTLPVTDNFPSGGPEQSWIDYNGAYSNVEAFSPAAPSGDGYVMNVNDGSYHETIFLVNDNGSLSDYIVTAWFYVPANAVVWSRMGIQVRCQANNNWTVDGIYFILDTDGDDYLRISGRAGGTYAEIERQTETYTRDAWHKMEVEAVGTSLKARLDDVEVYSNPTLFTGTYAYASGYIGLYNYIDGNLADGGSAALIDRVTIDAPPPPQASASDWQLYN